MPIFFSPASTRWSVFYTLISESCACFFTSNYHCIILSRFLGVDNTAYFRSMVIEKRKLTSSHPETLACVVTKVGHGARSVCLAGKARKARVVLGVDRNDSQHDIEWISQWGAERDPILKCEIMCVFEMWAESSTYHQHRPRLSCLGAQLLLDFVLAISWRFPILLLWLCHHHPCRTMRMPLKIPNGNTEKEKKRANIQHVAKIKDYINSRRVFEADVCLSRPPSDNGNGRKISSYRNTHGLSDEPLNSAICSSVNWSA